MKTLALLVGLVILVLGVLGLIAPDTFLLIARRMATPVGIYIAALVRVAIGLVLVGAAPGSRSPIGLRVIGALCFLGGLVTPFVGVDRARTSVEWWAEQGSGVQRLWAVLAITLGVFVAYAVTGAGRPMLRRPRPAT